MATKVGFLYSRVREEEKMLLKELEKRNAKVTMVDDRECYFDIDPNVCNIQFDVVMNRSISFTRGLYSVACYEQCNIPAVNNFKVSSICGDKAWTSLLLKKAGVPTPRTAIAFSEESALKAIEKMGGYPVVLKPVSGSWGRLIAKVSDREAAEAILEHKQSLGEFVHSVFYIQEFIKKPGRDIRAFVIDNELVAAIYRISEHWITNTARGGGSEPCPFTPELKEICAKTSEAIGGGILAVDLMEDKKEGNFLVHEVNHTPEFRNTVKSNPDLPKLLVDYVLKVAKK